MTIQSTFTLTLPTTDSAVPPNALAVGELTALEFVVASGSAPAVTYSYPLPATTPVGATVTVKFSDIGFSPVGGQLYAADVYAVDANGNGLASSTITWTEGAVPAAPTGFSVS